MHNKPSVSQNRIFSSNDVTLNGYSATKGVSKPDSLENIDNYNIMCKEERIEASSVLSMSSTPPHKPSMYKT
jgi:hypothetical protein